MMHHAGSPCGLSVGERMRRDGAYVRWRSARGGLALALILPLVAVAAGWSDNFDSYPSGVGISGRGGWTGWGGNTSLNATVSSAEAYSGSQSLVLQPTSDMVHLLSATSGQWTMRMKVFIPSGHTGGTSLVLMNTYVAASQTYNWSDMIEFRNGRVTSYGGSNFYSLAGKSMELVPDQWVDLRVDVDLAANLQWIYYHGTLLHATAWQADGVSRMQAIDLFSDGGSAAYFDDVVLEPRTAFPDCNGNGVDDAADIAAGTSQDCNGDGIPDECLTNGALSFAPARNYAAGGGPLDVAAADLDGDGNEDLAVTDQEGLVAVLKNNGDGTFASAKTYAVGSQPRAIVAVDVNKDGKKDLVTANVGGMSVSILINKGDGTFNGQRVVSLPEGVFGVAAADFDHDGNIELAAAGGYQSVWLLANNGAGGFTLENTLYVALRPNSIATADVDGDGYFDLVIANNDAASGIAVLRNSGSGAFALAQQVYLQERPFQLAIADFDGDGAVDIAATALMGDGQDIGSSSVFVASNQGDGTFGVPANYPVGSVVEAIAAADIDGDAHTDLVVVGFASHVWLLPNDARGGFAPLVPLRANSGPTGVAAGDFDGDGKLDLVVGNINSSDVSILRNQSVRVHTDYDNDGIPDACVAGSGNWIRGDVNGDKGIDIGDAIFVLTYLFGKGPTPACLGSANVNGDGEINIADAVFTLNYLFAQGEPPVGAFPRCDTFPGCGANCPK
jgi:hypothetical protein